MDYRNEGANGSVIEGYNLPRKEQEKAKAVRNGELFLNAIAASGNRVATIEVRALVICSAQAKIEGLLRVRDKKRGEKHFR